MKVPDNTYFGEKLGGGGGASYGEVRLVTDEQEKLLLLQSRINDLLIKQIDALTFKDSNGKLLVWSPFPLTILTLLSIETLGRIIGDVEKIKERNDYEISKIIATPIYKLMDVKLSHGVTIKFHDAFTKLHGKTDKKSLNVYSDVIHKYQRNTFIHGYQAKGVYLTHEIDSPWIKKEEEGFLVINPYLFWELFKTTYHKIFKEILNRKKPEWRKNALNYFSELLN